jgi:UDP-glucose 4-epimerase
MKVVVTGGLGKLGRAVVEVLREDWPGNGRHEVLVLDRAAEADAPGVEYRVVDVEDPKAVWDALADSEAIIHLAGVSRDGQAPDDVTIRTNVVGAFNIHEAALRHGIRRVVTASSQSVLGVESETVELRYLPVDEDYAVNPQNAYGLSKELVETLVRAYARKGLETLALRPNYVVTRAELDVLRREGGRKATDFRLFSYVDSLDAAAAFRLAIERPVPAGEALFIVADDSCVAEPLCELLPRLRPALGDKARQLTGRRAAISNERAKQVLGWQPAHTWRSAPQAG